MAPEGQQPPDIDAATAAKAANRFDSRRIIGGLFLVYGLILVVVGIAGSDAVKNKAAGVNVNLWTGLGMLVFGVLMVFWALSGPAGRARPGARPLRTPPSVIRSGSPAGASTSTLPRHVTPAPNVTSPRTTSRAQSRSDGGPAGNRASKSARVLKCAVSSATNGSSARRSTRASSARRYTSERRTSR